MANWQMDNNIPHCAQCGKVNGKKQKQIEWKLSRKSQNGIESLLLKLKHKEKLQKNKYNQIFIDSFNIMNHAHEISNARQAKS